MSTGPAAPRIGLSAQFHADDAARVVDAPAHLRALHMHDLRLDLQAGHEEWNATLIAAFGAVEVLAALHDLPHAPDAAAALIDRLPDRLTAIELDGAAPVGVLQAACAAAGQRGLRVALRVEASHPHLPAIAGLSAISLRHVALDDAPAPWAIALQSVRRLHPHLPVWLVAGHADWRHAPLPALHAYQQAEAAGADRVYWHALQDAPFDAPEPHGDPRLGHLGLLNAAGQPKLLYRLIAGGTAAQDRVAQLALAAPAIATTQPVLVTGGAGFIGSNLADRLALDGHHVLVLDALARPGVERNLAWLRRRHPRLVATAITDLRDRPAVRDAAARAACVFHLAAQVAVTTSMVDPEDDLDINLRGTFNLIDALRRRTTPAPMIFASTNKVYGDLGDVGVVEDGGRYEPVDPQIRAHGIGEDRPLDFHTPYGCSKGAADQYVLDMTRSYGVPSAVLRMSCIYGPRQMGTEDQGWLAHFLISVLDDRPITLYGDGKQVRDALYVDDCVAAYLAAWGRIGQVSGRAYNLGGGPDNAVTLRQVVREIERLTGRHADIAHADWRPGDQRYFVADSRRAMAALGLAKPIGWRDGLARLAGWMRDQRAQSQPRALETA